MALCNVSISNINNGLEKVYNIKHKLILKLIIDFNFKPSDIIKIKVGNLDFDKKKINLGNSSYSIDKNLIKDFYEYFNKFELETHSDNFLFFGRKKGSKMSRLNVHNICSRFSSIVAPNASTSLSPIVLRTLNEEKRNSNTESNLRFNEISNIEYLVNKNRNVMVLGKKGVGKSYLISSLKLNRTILFLDNFIDLKSTFIQWLMIINKEDKNSVVKNVADSSNKTNLKYLQRSSVTHLLRTIVDTVEKNSFILAIDSFESITPRKAKILQDLKDNFTIIACTREIPKEQEIIWDFDVVEIFNLKKEETYSFIEKECIKTGLVIGNHKKQDIYDKIYKVSNGNPRLIVDILKNLQSENNLLSERSTVFMAKKFYSKDISLFPIIIMVFIILIPLRYLAPITGNINHRIIGTIALSVFLLFRLSRRLLK